MPRWLLAIVLGLTACGGRVHVNAPPAAPTPAPSPSTAPDPVVGAGQQPVVTTPDPGISVAGDTTPTPQAKQARDSAADAAALDSLSRIAPAASLPELPIATRATWDLNVADFAGQPRVQYYLDYFTGRAHGRFQIWLERMRRYEAYARAQFVARKLPGDFVYLALIESGYSPEAVSRTYAVGIWQFMLGTGKLYGLRVDSWVDERRDPIKATDAAAHDLNDLTARFGSPYLAAAAYNAGAGRVERGLDRIHAPGATGDDSIDVTSDSAFFSLADTRLIRDETKNYVPQLIAAAILAKQPEKYGFDVVATTVPFSRDSVMVDAGTGLDLIARLADTTLDAMRDLNPHLLRLITPPDGSYPVRVPAGSADRVAAAYAATPPDQRHALAVHQVKAGETVGTLARRYGTTSDVIRNANRNARGRMLTPGSTVYVPVNTIIPASFLREPDPPRTIRFSSRTFIVRAGETVSTFARRVGVSAARVRSDNGLATSARLHAGERLVIRRTTIVGGSRNTGARRVSAVPAQHTHVVQSGETVGSIAAQYGLRQSVLMAANGLPKAAQLRIRQTLRIPGG